MGGSLGAPPALPPSGLTLHLAARDATHRALLPRFTPLNCDARNPREHSLDSHVALTFIAGPILWTGCYDAKQ